MAMMYLFWFTVGVIIGWISLIVWVSWRMGSFLDKAE
jgi:hypothetical protein